MAVCDVTVKDCLKQVLKSFQRDRITETVINEIR